MIDLGNDKFVSSAELAEFFGLTERRVHQLVNDGHIPRTDRGEYPLQESIQGYIKFLQARVSGRQSSSDEQAERTRLTAVKADLAELDHAEKVGELINAEGVRKQDFQIARILRNNLQSIPDRIAALVAAETDAAVVHDLITGEVNQSLESAIDAMDAEEVDELELDITRHNAHELLAEAEQEPAAT